MLQRIHERIKGWFAGVVIAIISATFILWGVQYYLQSSGADKAVAKVNGEKITEQQLNLSFQQVQRQYMMKTGHVLTEAQNQQLKQYTLQNLIMDHVLQQAVHQAGFRAGANQVDALIASMPQFQTAGQFSPEKYQQLLYANSLTPMTFMKQIANEYVLQQLQNGIAKTAFVLPSELQNHFRLDHQQRSFNYVILSQARFAQTTAVTPELIKNYYQQHEADFKTPEKVSLEYITLSPQQIQNRVTVSAAEIQQYYQDNFKNYQVQKKSFAAAQAEIKKILVQQKANTLFTQESDQLSDLTYTNPTSLKNAAKTLQLSIQTTPLLSREGEATVHLDPKMLVAAFSDDVLGQGNNSDPIELKDGSLVVLRVKDHEVSRTRSLAEVTSQIQKTVAQQHAQANAALAAAELTTLMNQDQSPSAWMHQHQLTWQSQQNVTKNNTTLPPVLVTAAFSLTLEKNHTATTVVLPNGDSAVVQLQAIKDPVAKILTAKEQQALQQNLLTSEGQKEYQQFVQTARDNAKIKLSAAAK